MRWKKAVIALLYTSCKFCCLIYYIISILFRVCFNPDFLFYSGAALSIFIDYLVDFFFLLDFIWYFVWRKRTNYSSSTGTASSAALIVGGTGGLGPNNASNKIASLDEGTAGLPMNPMIERLFGSKWNSIVFTVDLFLSVVELLPFELFAYLLGLPRYYNYRSFRLIRIRCYFYYWNEIAKLFYEFHVLMSQPIQRLIFLVITMGVVGHVFACAWYGLAVNVMLKGYRQTWLYYDGLAYLDNGELIITNSISYRYLRAIYWSIQTLDTVGYGDIVAHSESETWFAILYFYLSAFLIYCSIANLMTIVADMDRSKMKSLIKISRFNQYGNNRKLSMHLSQRVKSYYDYQLQQMNGFDEQEILNELPSNISQQIHHHIVRKLLLNIDAFKSFNKGLLNALCEIIEPYVFSPEDVIITEEGRIGGLFMIAQGDIEKYTKYEQGELIETLTAGQSFGMAALKKAYSSAETYKARSFVEIFYLRGSAYRHTIELYKERTNAALTNTTLARNDPSSKLITNDSMRATYLRPPMLVSWSSIRKTMDSLPTIEYWKNYFRKMVEKSLQPESTFREWWNNFIFFGLLFYLTSIALLLSGTFDHKFLQNYFNLLIAGYAVDLFFLIDIVCQATIFQQISEGVHLKTLQEIRTLFLQQHSLLYILCWLIPYDAIIGFLVDIRLLPVLRLLKLLHMHRFFTLADDCIESFSLLFQINFSFEFIRFIALYLLLFELCHWAGCIWLMAAEMSTRYFHFNVSWKWNDQYHLTGFANDYNAFYGVGYTRSIYWAASVMSSIGFPDILPTNPVEYVVIIFEMFFGYLMFNTLLGAIATMIGNFNREKREFNQKVEKIHDLMEFSMVPRSIETKTRRYFEYLWTRCEGIDETEVLQSLPKSLRSDVVHHVVGPLFHKIPFFQSCSEHLEHYLLEMFESRVFLHGEALMYAGDIGREMFVIERGNAVVTSADRKMVYARLTAGDYAGESSLLESKPRAASVFAVGYVDTYFISNEDFETAAEKFPTEYLSILNHINDTIAEKQERNAALTAAANNPATKENGKTDLTDSDGLSAKNNVYGFNIFQDEIENRMSFFMAMEDEKDARNTQFRERLKGLRYIIPLVSFRRLLWDNIIFAIMIYFAIIIPLRITLIIPDWFYWIDYGCDVINIVDAYLNFNHFSVNAHGKALIKQSEIRRNYLQYRFYVDLVVNLPYDLLAFIIVAVHQQPIFWFVRAILRLPKMMKFMLFNVYHHQVERLSALLRIYPLVYKVMELTLSLLLLGLWVACGWDLFSEFKNHSCDDDAGGFNCKFVNTWVEAQYNLGKLAANGSGQWTRLLRSFNWAIPTLVSQSMGDITGMNEMESLYAFFVMFCGLTVNGAIIGFVVALVSDANAEITKLYRKKEIIRQYLTAHNITEPLIVSAEGYITYLLTNEGFLITNREQIFEQLPHSLKIEVDKCLKTIPYLRRCPFFDFCTEEVLRKLSSKLTTQLYIRQDKIIQEGDLGYEMFFLESGRVHVISGDGKTVYSTLEEGSFFGETALFFKTPRAATIQVISPFCVCLILSKYDLDNELRSLQYDEEEVLEIFKSLQESNQRRNEAVAKNLAFSKLTNHKLHQLIPAKDKEIKKLSRVLSLRYALAPNSVFRMIWDIAGLIFLIYYIFSIPLFIAFLDNQKLQEDYLYKSFEIVVDIYWMIDIVAKSFFFSYQFDDITKKIIVDGEMIWDRYWKSYFVWDVLSSIPIEVLIVIPSLNIYYLPIYMSRSSHLLRVLQINNYALAVEKHIKHYLHIAINRTTSLLFKAGFAYVVLNHWMSSVSFILHRYPEIHSPVTYVIADYLAEYDPTTGRHNICSSRVTHCYARSIMYVLGTITAGNSGISPHTNNEIIWELVVSVIGAYIAAIVLTFIQTYQMDRDARHSSNYRLKLLEIESYCKYRKLSKNISTMIITQYHYHHHLNHHLRYRIGELLSLLSIPLQIEIYRQLHSEVIETIPVLRDASQIIKRRIAAKLRSQLLLEKNCLYSAGDIGKEIFFVLSGEIELHLSKDVSTLDGFGLLSLPLLYYKQVFHSFYYTRGDHFGECCLLSNSGLRPDTAIATKTSEVYYISKADLWELFLFTPIESRREFIHELFTRINEDYFIEHELSAYNYTEIENNQFQASTNEADQKIHRLFKLSLDILYEILETLPDIEEMTKTLSSSTRSTSVSHRRKHRLHPAGNNGTSSKFSSSIRSSIIFSAAGAGTSSKRPKRLFTVSVPRLTSWKSLSKNKIQVESASIDPSHPKSAVSNNAAANAIRDRSNSEALENEQQEEELLKYDKENEEIKVFIKEHSFVKKTHHDLLMQQYEDRVLSNKSMRRAFSAESIMLRKRAESSLSGDIQGDNFPATATNDSFSQRDRAISFSSSRDRDDNDSPINYFYSLNDGDQVSEFELQRDEENEGASFSDHSSEHSSVDDDPEVSNAISHRSASPTQFFGDSGKPFEQYRLLPQKSLYKKDHRLTQNNSPSIREIDEKSHLLIEDLEEPKAEALKGEHAVKEDLKDDEGKNQELTPPSSFTPKATEKKTQKDVLTSLSTAKNQKKKKSKHRLSFSKPTQASTDRRHSSYVAGYHFPTNTLDLMEIFGDERGPKVPGQIQTKHRFNFPILKSNQSASPPKPIGSKTLLDGNSSPSKKISIVQTIKEETEGAEEGNNHNDDHDNDDADMTVSEENDRNSITPLKRRATLPEQVLFSHDEKITHFKEKLSEQFKIHNSSVTTRMTNTPQFASQIQSPSRLDNNNSLPFATRHEGETVITDIEQL